MTSYVYRLYDEQKALLYVGCTADPYKRFKQHRQNSIFGSLMTRARIAVYPDKQTALAAEKAAIVAEQPLWNVAFRTEAGSGTWGNGVRNLRAAHALTQRELAKSAGCTQVTVSRVERGDRQVSDSLRLRIARVFDVNPYALFPYEDDDAA